MNQYLAENKRVLWIALVVGILLFILKFIAYFLTKSNAIFTDATESVVNILASGIGLYSLIYSARPKDKDHPHGHGKIEFLSSAVEGAMILMASIGICYKAISGMFFPETLEKLDVGIWLILISGAINYAVGYVMLLKGRKSDSLLLEGGGKHLQTDAYTTAGILIGLGLVYFTGIKILDSVTALVFGLLIMITGYRLIRKSLSGIMDEADTNVVKDLSEILNENRNPQWVDVHKLRLIKYGASWHIDCHLTLPWYYSLKEAHEQVSDFEKTVRDNSQREVDLWVHTDPCIEESCKICIYSACRLRLHPLEKPVIWNSENIMQNAKHGL